MSPWLAGAGVLTLALIPPGVVAMRGDPVRRLVGLEMGGITLSMVLLLLEEAFQRPIFADLAVALALLSLGGGLVFARFLARWL